MRKKCLILLLCVCLMAALLSMGANAEPTDDASPGLRFKGVDWQWESNERVYFERPDDMWPGSLAPGNSMWLSVYYDDGTGNLVRVKPDQLTCTGPFTVTALSDDYVELRCSGFGEGKLTDTQHSVSVNLLGDLPPIGFYSSKTPSQAAFLTQWDITGADNVIYLVCRENNWTMDSITDRNNTGITYTLSDDKTCAEIHLSDPQNTHLNLEIRLAGGGNAGAGIEIADKRPGLRFKGVDWRWENNERVFFERSDDIRLGSLAPGNSMWLSVYYDDGTGNLVRVKPDQLTCTGPFTVTVLSDNYVELRCTGFGEAKLTDTQHSASAKLLGDLPWIGFYSGKTPSQAAFLTRWDITGDDNVIYLVCRENERTMDSITDRNNTGITYTLSDDKTCAEIHLSDPQNDFLNLEIRLAGGGNAGAGIEIADKRPGLRFKGVDWRWENNERVFFERSDDIRLGSLAPGNSMWLSVYYDDGTGNLVRVKPDQLTCTGPFTVAALSDDYVELRCSGFGEGKLTDTQHSASAKLLGDLPWIGFYSGKTASQDTFLTRWDLTGDDSVIYLVCRENERTMDSITDRNNTGITYTLSDDKTCAEIHLTDPRNTYLNLEIRLAGGGNAGAGIEIADKRPGLVFCSPGWDAAAMHPIPNPNAEQQVRRERITASPNSSRLLEFFRRDENGQLIRLHAADLTTVGNFLVQDTGDFVEIIFLDFGPGTITCQGGVIPVNVVLPDTGFYSAPVVSEENYQASGNRYDGKGPTVYYTTATPGDLVITEAVSDNPDVTAAVEPGGKFVRIDAPQGQLGDFGAAINLIGTSAALADGSWKAVINVNLRNIQPVLHCIPILPPSDTFAFGNVYSGIGDRIGVSRYICPLIDTQNGMEVYTGTLTSADPGIVAVELYDQTEHIWKVTFLGDGSSWITGTLEGEDYYIEVRPDGTGQVPGKRMFFHVVHLPHTDYIAEDAWYSGFGFSVGDSRLYQFVDEWGAPITGGFTWDPGCLEMEPFPNPDLPGVFRITAKRAGEFHLTSGNRSCEVFFHAYARSLEAVPEKKATCTDAGNLACWKDKEDGQLYMLPDFPYDADTVLTRAKAAQFLCTAFGFSDPGQENLFTDVPEDLPERSAILTACRYRILLGFGDGRFQPDSLMTRAQLAMCLSRCLNGSFNLQDIPAELKAGDVGDSSWYSEAVYFCLANGLMHTAEDGTFSPNSSAAFGDIDLPALLCWTGIRPVTPGEAEIPALYPQEGHDWGTWVMARPATENEEGLETRTCSKCGDMETRAIPRIKEAPIEKVEKDEEKITVTLEVPCVDTVQVLLARYDDNGRFLDLKFDVIAAGSQSAILDAPDGGHWIVTVLNKDLAPLSKEFTDTEE